MKSYPESSPKYPNPGSLGNPKNEETQKTQKNIDFTMSASSAKQARVSARPKSKNSRFEEFVEETECLDFESGDEESRSEIDDEESSGSSSGSENEVSDDSDVAPAHIVAQVSAKVKARVEQDGSRKEKASNQSTKDKTQEKSKKSSRSSKISGRSYECRSALRALADRL